MIRIPGFASKLLCSVSAGLTPVNIHFHYFCGRAASKQTKSLVFQTHQIEIQHERTAHGGQGGRDPEEVDPSGRAGDEICIAVKSNARQRECTSSRGHAGSHAAGPRRQVMRSGGGSFEAISV